MSERVFYAFGAWANPADVEAMRADPGARAALDRVAALCERATPGTCRMVAHVDLRPPAH